MKTAWIVTASIFAFSLLLFLFAVLQSGWRPKLPPALKMTGWRWRPSRPVIAMLFLGLLFAGVWWGVTTLLEKRGGQPRGGGKAATAREVILSPYNPNVILACNGERSAAIRTSAYPSYMGWREHSCEMEVYVNGKGPVHVKPTENGTDLREEMVSGTNVPLLRAGETIRTLQFQFLETEGQVEAYAEFKY